MINRADGFGVSSVLLFASQSSRPTRLCVGADYLGEDKRPAPCACVRRRYDGEEKELPNITLFVA